MNIRKVPREFTLPVLIFAFIFSLTDYNILTAWNLRPPWSWWGNLGASPIVIIENVIIPILLFLVVYRKSSQSSDQGPLDRFLISSVIYGGIGVFISTLLLSLYPISGDPRYWGSILGYTIWRTIEYTPKLVFPSLAAKMYSRLNHSPSAQSLE